MAPECLNGRSYDEKVDSYSYAIVMYEMIFRKIPFSDSGLDAMGVALAVKNGKRPETSLSADTPLELLSLMKDAWDQEPARRPSMTQILDRVKTAIPRAAPKQKKDK